MKILDTRDLYKRKCELEDLRDAVTAAQEELDEAKGKLAALEETPEDEASEAELEIASDEVCDAESNLESTQSDFGTEEQEELEELENLESEISDFRHGESMIPESEFEDYARQLAEDIVAISDDLAWPCTCIDWEQAAKELAMNYSTVTYQGEDYLVRA